MERTGNEFTQLESQLFSKIAYIEKFNISTKYLPKRVEPGIGTELNLEGKWSKFSGETLFINQSLLEDKTYQEAIFWREAFLLFIPLSIRDVWWVRLLANTFPLSIKLNTSENNNWINLWQNASKEHKELIEKLQLIAGSAGSEGIIKVLKQSLYQILTTYEDNVKLGVKANKITELDPHEFEIIITNIQNESITISESAIDIMEIALIKQTISPFIINQFSNKHPTTIAKIINKLLTMKILKHGYEIDCSKCGLTQYIVLLICTKQQSIFFHYPPKNPFLYSHKFNCLNICVITQYYVAPKSKLFYEYLVGYCEELKQNNKIVNFYAFEIIDSYRSYLFKYFNPKTKSQSININDIAIESGLFDTQGSKLNHESKPIGNIAIPSRAINSKPIDLDIVDIKIFNQFLLGNSNRRIIQKNINKDMNEIIRRINYLYDKEIIYENIKAYLPESIGEIVFYIEDKQMNTSNKPEPTLIDRITNFSNYLPNVYMGKIEGSFKGVLLYSLLPSSTALQLADFFNWFLPANINNQIILGKSTFQKYRGTFDESRWNNGEWIFSSEDFLI
ncbi:MAG: hypothetical protein JXA54_05925 [Candidatus Heimdallarchaeota archaeon]|nr:hypothetical protein [Candidatus Heimdallarchaeota archaeon]